MMPIVLAAQLLNNQARRHFVGYTSNILHEYPDQAAQSSVNVNYKAPSEVSGRYYNEGSFPSRTNRANTQSQLFNVGYSVRFTGDKPKALRQAVPTPQTFGKEEIITGTKKHNEEVEGPGVRFSPKDFVSTAFLANNQKEKFQKKYYPGQISNPPAAFHQPLLSPITQKYYKDLQQSKRVIPNNQALQQKYSWNHLGSNTEIIKSTEIPSPVQFDHFRALGRSQDFDHSNAIEINVNPQQPLQFAYQSQPHQAIDTSLLNEPPQINTRYLNEALKKIHEDKPHRIAYQDLSDYSSSEQVYQQEPLRKPYTLYGNPQPILLEQVQDPRQPRAIVNTHLRPPSLGVVQYQRRYLLY